MQFWRENWDFSKIRIFFQFFFSNFSRTLFWMFIRYSRFHYSFFLLISWQKKMFHVLTKNLPFGNLDRDDFFEECSFSIHFYVLKKLFFSAALHLTFNLFLPRLCLSWKVQKKWREEFMRKCILKQLFLS